MSDDVKIRRMKFSALLPLLIQKMNETHSACIGKDGLKHKPDSLHFYGLAMDIDLYTKEGTYLDRTEDHTMFGEFWESLDPNCRWGGRFGDGNHYSYAYKGKA